MKLTAKLFLILLGLVAIMLVTSLSLAQWSFKQGFLEFVAGLEQSRLENMGEALVEHYIDSGNSWDEVQDIELQSLIPNNRSQNAPPPHRSPTFRPKGLNDAPPQHRPPPPHRRERPREDNFNPRDENKAQNTGPQTGLFDLKGMLLSGVDKSNETPYTFKYPLIVNQIKIAELRSWPRVEGAYGSASLFAQNQLLASVIIGVICLFIAGLLSWLISRKLLQPIQQIMQGVSELSAGNYDVKLAHQRHDELGELMNNVDYLGQTLNKNRSAKNRLFADISHELRTPLTVLGGEIDLLKEGIRPFNQQNLLSLEQETARLSHLVNDLYQLSLSDAGALRYTMVDEDLSQCIVRCIDSVQLRAQSNGLQINADIQPNIGMLMDRTRIEQLALNLLMNAIAYTDSPGNINISLSRQTDKILLQINDSKPSVQQADCEKLFEPMFRLDASRTRRASGAGLGLTISKNIVEAHHGNISASPSALGGLSIIVQFPLPKGEK